MKKKSARERRYLVTYTITRVETYRITAPSVEQAEQLAYIDGEFVDYGDTLNIDPLECALETRPQGGRQ